MSYINTDKTNWNTGTDSYSSGPLSSPRIICIYSCHNYVQPQKTVWCLSLSHTDSSQPQFWQMQEPGAVSDQTGPTVPGIL